MFSTDHIHEKPTERPDLFAFELTGEVTRDEMTAMAGRMDAAFDAHDEVDMMLVFRTDETSETGAGVSLENMKAQMRALSKVRRYAVVNAPGRAGEAVDAMGGISPVAARAFETEADARDWLDARTA